MAKSYIHELGDKLSKNSTAENLPGHIKEIAPVMYNDGNNNYASIQSALNGKQNTLPTSGTASSTYAINISGTAGSVKPNSLAAGIVGLSFSGVTWEDFAGTGTNSLFAKIPWDTNTSKSAHIFGRIYNLPTGWTANTGLPSVSYALFVAYKASDAYVVEVNQNPKLTGAVRAGVLRIHLSSASGIVRLEKLVTATTSAVGSSSIPTYVNQYGVITACTDDFVHTGSIDQSYDGTSSNPQSGTAVAEVVSGIKTALDRIMVIGSASSISNDQVIFLVADCGTAGNLYNSGVTISYVNSKNGYACFLHATPRLVGGSSFSCISYALTDSMARCPLKIVVWKDSSDNHYYIGFATTQNGQATIGYTPIGAYASSYSTARIALSSITVIAEARPKIICSKTQLDTAISTLDTSVVHKTGAETITGVKTFNNAVSPRVTGESFAKQSKVFVGSVITPYADWTAAQKDGNHYRTWTVDLTSIVTSASTHCNIVVKMMGSYYTDPGIGALQKELTFQINNGNVVISKGDYVIAQSPGADEFAISDVFKSGDSYLVQVVNRKPTANNYPLRLELEMFNRNASAVLDNVTLTEAIVEGLPSWAVDVAQVTASGSPVLTEATAAEVAMTGSYSDLSGTPTLGTAASKDVPANGDDATSTQVVMGSDSRLIDSRPPKTHTHDDRYYTESEIDTKLSGKQNTITFDGTYNASTNKAATVSTVTNAVSGKADVSSTVSNVAWDSTNKKITKTINGTTSDVVTASTLKSAMELDNLVHTTGTETITGQKVFKNNWPLMSSEVPMYKYEKPLSLDRGTNYDEWTSAQKDGNHFRRWRIQFSSLNGTYFVMRLKVIPGYYYENSTGCLEKMLVCRPNGTSSFPGGSSSSYTIAAGYAPNEYRINSVTYDSDLSSYVIEVVSCKPTSNNGAGAILEVINYGTNSTQHAVPDITVTFDIIEGWPSWAGDKNTAPVIQSNGMDVVRVGDIATEAKRVHAVWHYWNTSATTKWYDVFSVSQDGGNSSGYAGDMYAVTLRDSADNNCQCILTICGNSGGNVLDARLFAVKARTGDWASTKIYLYRQDDSHYTIYAKLERYGGIKIAPIVCQGTITYGTSVYDSQPLGTVEVDDRVQAFDYEVVTGSVPSTPAVGKFYLIS